MIIGFQHNAESMQRILTVNFTHQGAMQATRIHSCQSLYSGQRGAISLRMDTRREALFTFLSEGIIERLYLVMRKRTFERQCHLSHEMKISLSLTLRK